MHWEIGINTTQYRYDVALGGLDCSLRNVSSVVIRQYKLICHLVIRDGLLELLEALVIEHMMFRVNPTHFLIYLSKYGR